MHPLVPVVKISKKIGITGKIWEKAGVTFLGDLTKKSVNFSTLATSDIKLSSFFGKVDQQTKLVGLVKKNHYHRRKTQENDTWKVGKIEIVGNMRRMLVT